MVAPSAAASPAVSDTVAIAIAAVLAATGVEPLPWLLASLLLIGAGLVLTRTSRLRTR